MKTIPQDRLRAEAARARNAPWRGLQRVRARAPQIAQTALAAGAAYVLAGLLTDKPFFAPIAAVLALGAGQGQHLRRWIELVFGVAVGIAVADGLLIWLGSGTLQLMLIVALAMTAASFFGAGAMLINQSGVSAILVATVEQPETFQPNRFLHALIGGAVALLVGYVLFPRDPLAAARKAGEPVFAALSEALEATAEALRSGDPEASAHALELARDTDGPLADFDEALAGARETVRLAPARRRDRPQLEAYAEAGYQVELAVRNTRVLARNVNGAVRRGVDAEPELCEAIRLLARAVRALGDELSSPGTAESTRTLAAEAATLATRVLDRRNDLPTNVIVAQIRSAATDLLRGAGMDTGTAHQALGPYPV